VFDFNEPEYDGANDADGVFDLQGQQDDGKCITSIYPFVA